MADMPRVLILSGGISHERDISLKSGRKVADGLLSHGVSVELRDPDGSLIEYLGESSPEVIWPVLHGASGEDGALRALLEMLNIPNVGSTADASRIAWNKPVANSLGIPLIVKPAQGGSAQGVSWVDSNEGLRKAMVHAFTYSDIALIEKRIVGVEVCVPIIDTGDGPRAIPAVEIEPLSGHYDFEARYTAGATRFYTPPRLEQATLDSLSALALDAFTALGLRDLARVDFIVDNEGKPWFLEASTMPGLTETSSTALALDAAGYDVGGVYGALVEAALARP